MRLKLLFYPDPDHRFHWLQLKALTETEPGKQSIFASTELWHFPRFAKNGTTWDSTAACTMMHSDFVA